MKKGFHRVNVAGREQRTENGEPETRNPELKTRNREPLSPKVIMDYFFYL